MEKTGVLLGTASLRLGAGDEGSRPEKSCQSEPTATRLPRQDRLTFWRDGGRTLWPECIRSGRRGWVTPCSRTPRRGSGPRGLPGCLGTVSAQPPSLGFGASRSRPFWSHPLLSAWILPPASQACPNTFFPCHFLTPSQLSSSSAALAVMVSPFSKYRIYILPWHFLFAAIFSHG